MALPIFEVMGLVRQKPWLAKRHVYTLLRAENRVDKRHSENKFRNHKMRHILLIKEKTGDTMLTRRAFHQRLVAMAVVSALPRAGFASVGAAVPAAEQFLNRLSFGANDVSRAEYAALGAMGWLDAQLAMPVGDAGLDQRLGEARLRIAYEAGDDG